jgi:hypothetical protein
MELQLVRFLKSERRTIGRLSIDGESFCYTLEDTVRPLGQKVPGETAIPEGRYDIAMTYSPRFKVVLPLLLKVPGFEGVRIHAGNTEADTEGCILVGYNLDGEAISSSRLALAGLIDRLTLPASVSVSRGPA